MTNAELIAATLSALAAIIILIGRLWQTVKALVVEKKYSKLFAIVAEAMIYVETLSSLSG